MENRKRLLKNRQQIHIGKSKADYSIMIICKKHPKHRQSSSGVCSVCLTEKLTQLSRTSRSNITTTVTSSCSSLSPLSYLSSSSSSPIHHTMVSDLKIDNKSSTSVLTKSRSLAFIMRQGGGDKGGFLYRLLHPRKNKKDNIKGLVQSRTMKESFITKSGITNFLFPFSISS